MTYPPLDAKLLYKLTIEAYGQTETMHVVSFDGKHDHHRHPDVVDQARHDGEQILKTLDRMREKAAA